MKILGQVEGKRRDDARAWKLPMPVAAPVRTVLQNEYLRIPSVPAHIYWVSRKKAQNIDMDQSSIRCDSMDGQRIAETDASRRMIASNFD